MHEVVEELGHVVLMPDYTWLADGVVAQRRPVQRLGPQLNRKYDCQPNEHFYCQSLRRKRGEDGFGFVLGVLIHNFVLSDLYASKDGALFHLKATILLIRATLSHHLEVVILIVVGPLF